MPEPATPAPPPAPRFETCLAEVLRQEGGFSNHPLDPGGATNMGITRRTLARWRGVSPWWRLPAGDVRALARPDVVPIYRSLYWDRCNASAVPKGLDLALFDYAVNSGPERAIKALQGVVGALPDGFIGPLTLRAIGARVAVAGVAGLIMALCDARLNFLQRLAITATFGPGWSRRVAEIRAAALEMAGADKSQPQKGPTSMNLNILAGYKTYLVGAAMLIVGIAQLLGVTIPSFSGQSAGDLLMQGLAIIFLRQGITNTVAKS